MVEVSRGRSKIGEALKWLRESHQPKLTQDELAERTGVPKGSISSVEAGVSQNPRPHVLDPLLAFFGYPTAEAAIRAHRNHVVADAERVPVIAESGSVTIDVVAEASAGRGAAYRLREVLFVPAEDVGRRKLLAVKVIGRCMWPFLMPGDYVIFEKVADDEIRDGDRVLITLLDQEEDGAYLVKYLTWARNGEDKVILTAEDDTRLEVPYDRVVIEGRYWRLIRD